MDKYVISFNESCSSNKLYFHEMQICNCEWIKNAQNKSLCHRYRRLRLMATSDHCNISSKVTEEKSKNGEPSLGHWTKIMAMIKGIAKHMKQSTT